MSETADRLVGLTAVTEGIETVAIGGHVHPDGDCTGAVTGLYHYLKKLRPQLHVDVYLKKIPDAFAFLGDGIEIRDEADENDPQVYDLFISLDCADKGRLGFSQPVFDAAKKTVSIDHHVSNPMYADINRVAGGASSTCELLWEEMDPELVDQTIATALFIGIAHDTGIFRYSCTSPKTLEIAAKLLETGIDASSLITETYCEKTIEQQRATADAVLRAELYVDGKMIASTMSVSQREAHHAKSEHMDGIVEQLRDTRGIECSAFLHEYRQGVWKMSLRSAGKVDVQAIAAHFGGGGHVRAAGATIETEDPQSVIDQVAVCVREQLEA